jgi:hypothetical protein
MVLSVIVALGAGIVALPRWQAIVGVLASVGAIAFLFAK